MNWQSQDIQELKARIAELEEDLRAARAMTANVTLAFRAVQNREEARRIARGEFVQSLKALTGINLAPLCGA